MPSVTETTVPCGAHLGASIEILDLALDQFADFGGVQLHVVLASRRRGLRRRHGSSVRLATGLPSWELASTEPSITSSPTVMRAPPISAGSTLTASRSCLPKCFSSAALSSATCGVGQRKGAVDRGARHAFGVVLQRLEQRRDLRQQRRRGRLRPARGRSCAPADRAGRRRSTAAATSLSPAVEPRVVERAATCGSAITAAEQPQHLRPHRQRVAARAPAGTRLRRRDGRWWSVRPWRFLRAAA